MSVFWFFTNFPFSFFFPFVYSLFFIFCFVLFCFIYLLLFKVFTGDVLGSSWPCCILGWPYLVCALIVSWPSWLFVLSVILVWFLFLSKWLCFSSWKIFILMGRILIRVLNFSLQTKSNPRIIYFYKIFNSPTGNYPKWMLNSLRIAKGIHSYWWVLPIFCSQYLDIIDPAVSQGYLAPLCLGVGVHYYTCHL